MTDFINHGGIATIPDGYCQHPTCTREADDDTIIYSICGQNICQEHIGVYMADIKNHALYRAYNCIFLTVKYLANLRFCNPMIDVITTSNGVDTVVLSIRDINEFGHDFAPVFSFAHRPSLMSLVCFNVDTGTPFWFSSVCSRYKRKSDPDKRYFLENAIGEIVTHFYNTNGFIRNALVKIVDKQEEAEEGFDGFVDVDAFRETDEAVRSQTDAFVMRLSKSLRLSYEHMIKDNSQWVSNCMIPELGIAPRFLDDSYSFMTHAELDEDEIF